MCIPEVPFQDWHIPVGPCRDLFPRGGTGLQSLGRFGTWAVESSPASVCSPWLLRDFSSGRGHGSPPLGDSKSASLACSPAGPGDPEHSQEITSVGRSMGNSAWKITPGNLGAPLPSPLSLSQPGEPLLKWRLMSLIPPDKEIRHRAQG